MQDGSDEHALLGPSDVHARDARRLLGLVATPAYLRRAVSVDAAIEQFTQRCRRQQHEQLSFVRARLDVWHALVQRRGCVPAGVAAETSKVLNVLTGRVFSSPVAPKPWLRPGRSERVLKDLADSVRRFNCRWNRFANQIDATHVNRLIDGYNRFYVFEKECALTSARPAARGFEPLEAIGPDWVLQQFPMLPEPPV